MNFKFKIGQLVQVANEPYVHKVVEQTRDENSQRTYTVAVKDGIPITNVLEKLLTKA